LKSTFNNFVITARVDMITLHARGWNERKKKKPAQVLVYTVLEGK